MDSSIPTQEQKYLSVYLRADNHSRNHRRQTYRLIEYLGDIGGLIEFIKVVGMFMVGFIIDR